MAARIQGRAQADAMRNLYRPPDPGKEETPPVARQGFRGQTIGRGLHGNDNALRRLKALLPSLALESRIVLECARDLYLTGGIEVEDGKRLATAYERLKRAAEVVAAAEREVHG